MFDKVPSVLIYLQILTSRSGLVIALVGYQDFHQGQSMAKARAEVFHPREASLFASLGFLLHADNESTAKYPSHYRYLRATNCLNTSRDVSSVYT